MRKLMNLKVLCGLMGIMAGLAFLAPLVMAGDVSVTGQVQVMGEKVVLQVDDTVYVLIGEDLDQYTGKTVEVIGTIIEEDSHKVIQVEVVNPAE